jgi:Predicted Zn-dependent hydrolases of the beta-lactamase fold
VRTFHDQVKGAERGFNTVYIIHLDDLVFCHLGDLGHELTTSQLEEIGSNVDVLFVPVGGGETIGPALASNVISQIEPRFVIPMHYAMGQTNFDPPLAPIERFISEMGLKEYTAEDKFVINANALPEDEEQTRIVFLRPIHG